MTRHFYTISASGMSCKFCGKAFNHSFNLRRHKNEYCPLKGEEREMPETESQTADPEDDVSTVTTHGSESPMIEENDTETEEEEANPWVPMVEEAIQKHRTAFQEMKMNLVLSGLDEQTGGEEAYSNILSDLQKEFESIYLQRLQNALVNDDDFDPEKAMKAAVKKRKFLIKRRLTDYSFTDDSDKEDH